MKIQSFLMLTLLLVGSSASTLFGKQSFSSKFLISKVYAFVTFCCNNKKKLSKAMVAAGLGYKTHQSYHLHLAASASFQLYLNTYQDRFVKIGRNYLDIKDHDFKIVETRRKNQYLFVRKEKQASPGSSYIDGVIRCKTKDNDDCGSLHYQMSSVHLPHAYFFCCCSRTVSTPRHCDAHASDDARCILRSRWH